MLTSRSTVRRSGALSGSIFRCTPDVTSRRDNQADTLTTMEKRHIRIQPKHHQNDLLLPGHAFAAIAMAYLFCFMQSLAFQNVSSFPSGIRSCNTDIGVYSSPDYSSDLSVLWNSISSLPLSHSFCGAAHFDFFGLCVLAGV